ncbi:hypothetical protein BDF20DRAFT_883893 [Mycotypha africana]|uniref:uncharacterized protein n=1 Tax=Mycotypha africana TaxID=64632 RepID=UPI0023012697|nr:uncharacterized protein BDF20DRAFT_883893 [Mycotypha africana]KAI8973746.1 hypothetical protein BDF20DRAFT_883893 [Mycotypha africana]
MIMLSPFLHLFHLFQLFFIHISSFFQQALFSRMKQFTVSTTFSNIRSRCRKQRRTTITEEVDPDCLIDYDYHNTNTVTGRRSRKHGLSTLSSSFEKYKQRFVSGENKEHNKYILEYTTTTTTTTTPSVVTGEKTKTLIKRPRYNAESLGKTYQLPITMDAIRSIILEQHCHITKEEELEWFVEGMEWLAQQQSEKSKNSAGRYYIEEEKLYTGWDEDRINYQNDLEDLERACEAYFGIPLGICEDHWAADYLLNRASRKSLFFKRVHLFNSKRNLNSSRTNRVQRFLLCCFGL